MINLYKINTDLLKSDKEVSVSIIDTGFLKIPSYAKLYTKNSSYLSVHGSRILSIFTSLDKLYPIPNLKLNLSCYNPNTGYKGLIDSIQALPKSDILSISLAWKDDKYEIYKSILLKANKICVPYSNSIETPYPSAYKRGLIICSNSYNNQHADYCICPNQNWVGNSYSVPAIARLLAYGINPVNNENGELIKSLFISCNNSSTFFDLQNSIEKILKCPYCKRDLKTKYHTYMKQLPDECPFCGKKIK